MNTAPDLGETKGYCSKCDERVQIDITAMEVPYSVRLSLYKLGLIEVNEIYDQEFPLEKLFQILTILENSAETSLMGFQLPAKQALSP